MENTPLVFLIMISVAVFLLVWNLMVPVFGAERKAAKRLKGRLRRIATREKRASAAQMLRDKYIRKLSPFERMEDGTRRLVSFQEIDGMEGEIITMSEIFRFERTGVDPDNKVQGYFTATGVVPKLREHLAKRGQDVPLELFEPGRQD